MDDNLNIRVDVNTAPLGKLKEELKQVKSAFSMMDPNSSEGKATLDYASQLNTRIKDMSYQMSGLSGAVRQARTEKRMFRFALVEVMGGLDGVATSIDKLTGGGDNKGFAALSKSMTSALGAGMGVKFGMDMLGGEFEKISGPVGLAVGLFTAVAGALPGVTKETQNAREELEKYAKVNQDIIDKLMQLGIVPGAQGGNYYQSLIAGGQARIKSLSATSRTVTKTYKTGTDISEASMGPITSTEIVQLTKSELAENQTKINEIYSLIADWKLKLQSIDKKTIDMYKELNIGSLTGKIGLQSQVANAIAASGPPGMYNDHLEQSGIQKMAYGSGLSTNGASGEKFNPFDPTMRARLGEYKDVNYGELNVTQMTQEAMAENQRRANEFVNTLKGGFTQATSYLAEGLVKAFNLGDSLMSRMLGTILSSFAQAGIGYLTGQLFNPAQIATQVEVGNSINAGRRYP